MESSLIGFDARELNPPGDLWTPERRELFLLRTDAARPLSVDVMVWPSLFDHGQGIGLPESQRRQLRLAGLPIPSWIGANACLWSDLEAMRAHLSDNNPPATAGAKAPGCPAGTRYAIVAATWVSEHGFQSGDVGPYAEPTVPATPDPAWRLLGYDVADGSQCSGLSNCGYPEQEAPALRAEWRRRLNDNHLFADAHDAARFRELASARVRAHAPFFVYGLYVIEELDAA